MVIERVRRGISPVLAVVLLTGIVLVMSIGTYTFLNASQGTIFDPARQVDLRTVNVTCESDQVVWWLENTDDRAVEGTADLYIQEASGLNTTLTETGISTDADFVRPGGSGRLTVPLSGSLAPGRTYDLELAFDNAAEENRCQAGGTWWDLSWDYRRQVAVTNSHSTAVTDFPAGITLDTATLIASDKMADDCRDIRVVEGGDRVPHSVAACDTASTRINFTTDIAPGATEDDVNVYYGNPAASQVNVSTVPTRIVNGDFDQGWTGWTTAPASAGGQTEFWIDDWPDSGSCTDPGGTSDGPCSYPAATHTILSSGSGNASCSPDSGCPTPVLGDGNLNLDGSSDGGGYNGNIRSDPVEVPGGVHVHWWHNLQGRSSDTGRYDSATRWYGTGNSTSAGGAGEGPAWAVVVDRGVAGEFDSVDWLYDMAAFGNGNGGATTDLVEEKTVDVSGLAGNTLRIYIEQNQGGGGDDGLIQIDDLYWSDAAGNKITLSTSVGAEQEE